MERGGFTDKTPGLDLLPECGPVAAKPPVLVRRRQAKMMQERRMGHSLTGRSVCPESRRPAMADSINSLSQPPGKPAFCSRHDAGLNLIEAAARPGKILRQRLHVRKLAGQLRLS